MLLLALILIIGAFILTYSEDNRKKMLQHAIKSLEYNYKFGTNSLFILNDISLLKRAGHPWNKYANILIKRISLKFDEPKSSQISC